MNSTPKNNNRRTGQRSRTPKRNKSVRNGTLVPSTRFSLPPPVVQRFTRTTAYSTNLFVDSGFNGTGFYDMEMSFSLSNTQIFYGGVGPTNIPNPGYADFPSLFDQYCIEGIEISFMYSNNTATAGGGLGTALLPIMNIAYDYDDTSVISLSTILSYRNVQTIQLGNQRTQNGYVLSFKPKPVINNSTPAGDTWLSMVGPTQAHNALKIVWDTQSSPYIGQVGVMGMYIKYKLAFRLAH